MELVLPSRLVIQVGHQWISRNDQPRQDDVFLTRPVGCDGHHVVAGGHVFLEFHADFVVGLVFVLHLDGGRFGEGEVGQLGQSSAVLVWV